MDRYRTYRVSCLICRKEYSTAGIRSHMWRNHGEGINFRPTEKGKPAWNKGLTISDPRIKKSAEKFKKSYKEGKFKLVNKSHDPKVREKISESMKLAHRENRAWNIGKSRWNNKPSYPESFFMKVIDNEFEDKEYIREMPFGKYSLDFAWPHKRKCIEIDGEQHNLFPQKESDERKDKLIRESGWEVLRIPWKNMIQEPKKYIKCCKDYIEN